MMPPKSAIPEQYRGNKLFIQDLVTLLEFPAKAMERAIRTARQSTIGPTRLDARALAAEANKSIDEVAGPLSALAFVFQEVLDQGIAPIDAVAELAEETDRADLVDKHREALLDALSFTEEERDDSLALEAFSESPTYVDSRLRPSFRWFRSRFVSGFQWTIAYIDSQGETRSISFGLSHPEAKRVYRALGKALTESEQIPRPVVLGEEPTTR